MSTHILGVDVGGTNIKLGVLSEEGKIFARGHIPTQTYRQQKNKLIGAILEGIEDLLAKHHLTEKDLCGIGVGLPGVVDPQKGVVKFLPNIPGWKNVPLQRLMQRRLSIPVFLDNDVNLITLGEWRFGAGQGARNMMCMTLGTGVGCGLILNDALYRGEGFAASEFGHLPINENGPACNCGGWGCLEAYVGNGPLAARANALFGNPMSLEEIYRLANQGDEKAMGFWEETGHHIGNGLVAAVNLLNPTRLIIGGGVANNHKFLFPAIKQRIRERAMKFQAAMVKIRRSRLGNDAGVFGARVLVDEMLQQGKAS